MIKLQFSPASDSASSSMNTPVHHEEKETVLIVDDNIVNLKLLTAILVQHGYIVKSADSSFAGVEHLKEFHIDLILLDIKMPRINGYQFCLWLKSHPKTKHIPVIFLSGTKQSIARIKAFSVGGSDFIAKPFQSVDVLARIEHQLQLASLQKQLREKNETLAAEVSRRKKIESLLLGKTTQLQKEVKRRQYMEELLRLRNIRLTRQANVDELTQIANRRHFDNCLARELPRAIESHYPLSIAICDVDYFKRYNDYYGHQAGDHCLHKVAQTLADVVNLPGDLVARYGGEEFAMILPDTNRDAAIAVMKSVKDAISELAIQHHGSKISDHLTLSFGGYTLLPGEHAEDRELIKKADEALYLAKKKGRSRVCWHGEKSPKAVIFRSPMMIMTAPFHPKFC